MSLSNCTNRCQDDPIDFVVGKLPQKCWAKRSWVGQSVSHGWLEVSIPLVHVQTAPIRSRLSSK